MKRGEQGRRDKAFEPAVLPEIAAPQDARDCRLCELAAQRDRVIWGEGHPHAPLMIVLDNPGAREDREGRPFVCGTRDTLQRGLAEAGIGMDQVYLTYVLKCRPRKAYDKPLARSRCLPYLERQVAQLRPKLAFCLGNVATQVWFDDEEADVKKLRGVWRIVRGVPTLTAWHPLAVRRRPALYRFFVQDCRMVAERLFKL